MKNLGLWLLAGAGAVGVYLYSKAANAQLSTDQTQASQLATSLGFKVLNPGDYGLFPSALPAIPVGGPADVLVQFIADGKMATVHTTVLNAQNDPNVGTLYSGVVVSDTMGRLVPATPIMFYDKQIAR